MMEINLGNPKFKLIVRNCHETTYPFSTESWHLVLQGNYGEMVERLGQLDFTGEALRRMEMALDWSDAGHHVLRKRLAESKGETYSPGPYSRATSAARTGWDTRFYLVQDKRSRLKKHNIVISMT